MVGRGPGHVLPGLRRVRRRHRYDGDGELNGPEQWARDRLAVRELILVRSRPWADVWRVEVDGARWWLKVNGKGTTYEPRLLARLAELRPSLVPACIIHPDEPWSLIADAGLPLSELEPQPERSDQVDLWCRLLAEYAELQQAFGTAHRSGIGLPDFAPDRLLERFDEVLSDTVWFGAEVAPELSEDQLDRIRRVRPQLAEAARELGDGPAATVQHDDLHPSNVCVPPGAGLTGAKIIDWGDAVWAHPFQTLLVTLRSLAASWSVAPDAPELGRLREAYLEPWRTRGESRPELERQLDLAVRVGPLTRAAGWSRALGDPEAGRGLGFADAPSAWMLELADALGGPDGSR